MNKSSWKRPSAWLPVLMSVTALAIAFIHIIRFGTAREADEGTSAHLWQILMAGQVPIIAFFAIRWLPRNPKPALLILAIQAIASIAALGPVYYLGL